MFGVENCVKDEINENTNISLGICLLNCDVLYTQHVKQSFHIMDQPQNHPHQKYIKPHKFVWCIEVI